MYRTPKSLLRSPAVEIDSWTSSLHEHSDVHHRAKASKLQRDATVGSRQSPHRLHPRNLLACTTRASNTLSMDCNWRITEQPLRHDRDIDDLSLHTTGV